MTHDVKIRRVINKYGLKGYGLYCFVLESITKSLSTDDPAPIMEEDCNDIAIMFNDDTALVNEMLCFMVNQGLFEPDEMTGNIICHKIYKFLDSAQTKSVKVREMIKKYKDGLVTDGHGKSVTVTESHGKSMTVTENTDRIEENKKKNKNIAGKPAKWTELHEQIEESCLSQLTDKSQYNYGKERKHIKQLADRFETHDEPAEFAAAFFNTFYSLKHGNNKFWSSQPLLPSILNSDSIYPRIVEAMKKEDYTPTGAEVTF